MSTKLYTKIDSEKRNAKVLGKKKTNGWTVSVKIVS